MPVFGTIKIPQDDLDGFVDLGDNENTGSTIDTKFNLTFNETFTEARSS